MAQTGQSVAVRVDTVEGQLTCTVRHTDTGKDLFDKVVSAIGLEEFWYFGLQYETKTGNQFWLHMRKRVLEHDLKPATPLLVKFRVRFYPPDAGQDIIQDLTLKYFYLEAKQEVLDGTLYCPAEEALVLSSLAVQARYGNYDKKVHRRGYLTQSKAQYLPKRVQNLYKISHGDWERILTVLYELRKDVSAEDAQREYLCLAEDLYEYGMRCTKVTTKSGVEWIMGITSFGLSFFPLDEIFLPATAFHWGEITDMSTSLVNELFLWFKGETEAVSLTVPSLAVAKHLIRLCRGMSNMVLRCRNESQEVASMRARKEEEKATSTISNGHVPADGTYPSIYLYGGARIRHRDRRKHESLKESVIQKEESNRLKYIQKQLSQYEKDANNSAKDIREAETLVEKRKEKALASFASWKLSETQLRGDGNPLNAISVEQWLENGFKMNDDYWKVEVKNKKLISQCIKRHAVASKDRLDLHSAIKQWQNVKTRLSGMTSPAHLHVNDAEEKLDEMSPEMISELEIMKYGMNPYPWEHKESHEDKDLHIQQDLQSTRAMLMGLAKQLVEDEMDETFRDQTEGFSKYRMIRLFVQVPIKDRIFVLEKGEYVDPDDPEGSSEEKEGKRDFGLLGRRLVSKHGMFGNSDVPDSSGRPVSKMHVPEPNGTIPDSYDLTEFVDDL